MSEPWTGTPFEAEYHRLHDEIDRLRTVIQEVEYVRGREWGLLEDCCPSCRAHEDYEHRPDCRLAAALR